MRTACRFVVFHDIVNARVGWREAPLLWKDLTTPGQPKHAAEFAPSNCTQQPMNNRITMMGIGILSRIGATLPD